MAGRLARHRALADPTRERILDLLRAADGPLSVAELAPSLGLHANTVRSHLQVLEEADFVVSAADHTGWRGRPPIRFSAVPPEPEQEHALLAASLASALELLPDGVAIAQEAGRSWGRVMVERLEPGRDSDDEICIERVATLLRRRGFAPEATENGLVMNRCPFRDLAERYPRVVCSFHAGLIDGALVELGSGVALETLEAWVTPSTCVARFS
ncbi:helix-turn-helix domain-containing protein [Gaiella sp.]|uniref:helix-turn-helix transcriptional regulator n=1 Tax=Gaiella sp. TaxID=2663207 RepID=UPI003264373E